MLTFKLNLLRRCDLLQQLLTAAQNSQSSRRFPKCRSLKLEPSTPKPETKLLSLEPQAPHSKPKLRIMGPTDNHNQGLGQNPMSPNLSPLRGREVVMGGWAGIP